MSNIFRKSYTLPIPDGAELVTVKGVPSARFKRNGKTTTAPLTEKRDRIRVQSPGWYGRVGGQVVKQFTDAVASQQRLAELLRKAERKESGVTDPFEEHQRRPLAEHLTDWNAAIEHDGAGKAHADKVTNYVRRIMDVCKFTRIADISASRVQQFLADLRRDRLSGIIDPAKQVYTKRELAELLGVKPSAIGSLILRHRLTPYVEGQGKARRFKRPVAEALLALRAKGISIRTSNAQLAAIKQFCRWLVQDRRAAVTPLEHLAGGNVKLDRRHDRRILDERELRSLIAAAMESQVVFRGITGPDRAMIYIVACASGFRVSELAALTPRTFNLEGDSPEIVLGGAFTKNGKTAIQPLPIDLAVELREYLAGRALDSRVWPGTWHERAADMIRIDLDECGIPYVIQGPDGPLYADAHALRHSFIALLDKSGATLKEAMQLARHSDPKLTASVYGRARLRDLASAVDRLPTLTSHATSVKVTQELAATGTDGKRVAGHSARIDKRLPFPCRAVEEECDS